MFPKNSTPGPGLLTGTSHEADAHQGWFMRGQRSTGTFWVQPLLSSTQSSQWAPVGQKVESRATADWRSAGREKKMMNQPVLEASEVLPQPGSLWQNYRDRTEGCKIDCTSADLTFKLSFNSPFLLTCSLRRGTEAGGSHFHVLICDSMDPCSSKVWSAGELYRIQCPGKSTATFSYAIIVADFVKHFQCNPMNPRLPLTPLIHVDTSWNK